MTNGHEDKTQTGDINDDIVVDSSVDIDDSVVAEEAMGETIKALRVKLKDSEKKASEYLVGWQRAQADFMNVRKRDAEDNARFRKFASENLVAELLPVLESFNMAFGNKESWEKVDKNWRVGVEYIASQLKGVLEANGLRELNPLGEKFDPMLHEAAEFAEVADEKENQKIIAVIHKGYAFYDRVLKAPKVKVAETRMDAERTRADAEKEK